MARGALQVVALFALVACGRVRFDPLSATLPPARDSVGVIYDRARDVIVMYGGNSTVCATNCAETWEYVPD